MCFYSKVFLHGYELCVPCEEKGFAKCYFKSKMHKCKCGGTSDSTRMPLFRMVFILGLQPVLEKQEVVDHRIEVLRQLGVEYTVTTTFGQEDNLYMYLGLRKM